jgi:hypothetical protein
MYCDLSILEFEGSERQRAQRHLMAADVIDSFIERETDLEEIQTLMAYLRHHMERCRSILARLEMS